MSVWILPVFIVASVGAGIAAGVPVYDAFIRGAKQGMGVALRIIPYVVAFSFAVAFFRAGGGFELLNALLFPIFDALRFPVGVLPLAITRPFSGGAAMGVLSDILLRFGADSYEGVLASVMMGSSETVFYTVGLYYGSVGVKSTRYTVPAALIAEVAGIAAALIAVRLFGTAP